MCQKDFNGTVYSVQTDNVWGQEKFEDTKGVIRSLKLKKDRQHNMTKGQTIIYKTLHRKHHWKPSMNSGSKYIFIPWIIIDQIFDCMIQIKEFNYNINILTISWFLFDFWQ